MVRMDDQRWIWHGGIRLFSMLWSPLRTALNMGSSVMVRSSVNKTQCVARSIYCSQFAIIYSFIHPSIHTYACMCINIVYSSVCLSVFWSALNCALRNSIAVCAGILIASVVLATCLSKLKYHGREFGVTLVWYSNMWCDEIDSSSVNSFLGSTRKCSKLINVHKSESMLIKIKAIVEPIRTNRPILFFWTKYCLLILIKKIATTTATAMKLFNTWLELQSQQ